MTKSSSHKSSYAIASHGITGSSHMWLCDRFGGLKSHVVMCYGAAPELGQCASKNELRDLGWFNGEERLGRHTGLTEG